MKILYITNELNYACGVSTHLLNLSSGIAEQGNCEIHIIAGGGNGTERFDSEKYNVNINPNFLHERRSAIKFSKAVSYLIKYANDNLIDLIHSHTHYAANIAYCIKSFLNIQTIQTNHGILKQKGYLPHFSADRYIAINEHIYDYLQNELKIPRERISFIRCGIGIPEKPPEKNTAKLRILFASRLNYDKGADIFIRGVSLLTKREQEKCEFYIAGTGEEELKLIELSKSLNTDIKFLGMVKDMAALLKDTHITVFCSRSDTEGFPAIITEAGAYNNLVISSDFRGLQPSFEPEVNGFVFKTDSYENLTIILKTVINEYDKYKPFALNYYNKVKEMYSINEMINKHLELYNSCLRK